MLNKTVVVPVLSAAAMAAFTVWALLVGPPDSAHAGERAVASTTAAAPDGAHCVIAQQQPAAH
ncbi:MULTISPECIES: hypothetical protein [Ralstonia]|uniref:hypothetical protein n=1 Tax=Ralstonia TaxID=48736 RepID=UPI0009E58624|nr:MULTISPECIES: hypothetical protein [Ralstonia]MBU9578008.1 hypothetical protein [Ralstonia mannitolilytica]PLT19787.1 hypothetical protein CXP34_07555 [Ralstonia mannitolilytica]QIF08099.1 hypothetical protein G5A69_10835 [Ralstonia mannitolilytica]